MKSMFKRMLVLTSVAALSLTAVHAQESSALVDELVKKGVLTDQEAEDVRAKLSQEWASSAASKMMISNYIKSLKFYGDIRLRVENRSGAFQGADIDPGHTTSLQANNNGTQGTQTLDRLRYRLRAGIEAELYGGWYAGFGVATNPTNQRSGNVTLGQRDDGPFGKGQSATPAINKVYIGWHATDQLNVIAGQFDNPFFTEGLIWDDNITPAGLAESYDQTFGKFEVFANAGQLIYEANSTNGNTQGAVLPAVQGWTNTFMFDEQIGLAFKISDTMNIKAAIGMQTYSGSKDEAANNNGTDSTGANGSNFYTGISSVNTTAATNGQPYDFSGPFTGYAMGESNTYGINNLEVLQAPAEFNFKVGKIPFKIYGEFAVNLEAQDRSNAAQRAVVSGLSGLPYLASDKYQVALNRNNGGQDLAYQAGIQIGNVKKKGDWSIKTYWQSIGYYALDPNLLNADIFDARTNMQGVVIQGMYAFNDAISTRLTYADASRVDNTLATPGTGNDLNIDPIDHYRMLQADLNFKF